MKKLILILLLLYTQFSYACSINFNDLSDNRKREKLLKKLELDDNVCGGYDLFKKSEDLVNLNLILLPLGLNLKDFDMSTTIDKLNINEDIVTVYFYQKNKQYNDLNLYMYVSYNINTKRIMVIISDGDYQYVKVLGNKEKDLFTELVKSRYFPLELLFSPVVNNNLNFFYNE